MGSRHSKTSQTSTSIQDPAATASNRHGHRAEKLLKRMSLSLLRGQHKSNPAISNSSSSQKLEENGDSEHGVEHIVEGPEGHSGNVVDTSGKEDTSHEQRPLSGSSSAGRTEESAEPAENNVSDSQTEPPLNEPNYTKDISNQPISPPVIRAPNSVLNSQFIMPANTTVPCQYRTGKTLGSGTYAIVKEAIHIKTGKYYACKVINKKLMEGREYMVRNEIAVLKRISSGYPNIVTLHDYFETAHNLYLCFDLCTGGELFDRICAKGNYYEADAADLVRIIMRAVKYIHNAGIVHRDLKPENLLFRTPAEDADIMIADFGLSRIMEEEKFSMLTEICGTPGYMAPEIFKKTGHGKPVDIWAMGVITYFLLAGYTPFDRDSQQAEMEAIIAGDYKFEPIEYWANVSETARDFVRECLTIDPASRPTAEEALSHKWLADSQPHFVPDPDTQGPTDLLPHVMKAFNAKKLWRKAAFSIRAVNRMSALAGGQLPHTEAQKLSENEALEDVSIMHHHNLESSDGSSDSNRQTIKRELKEQDDLSVEDGKEPRMSDDAKMDHLENQMAKAALDDKDKSQSA
ncbi:calcium calmodulin dependent protein [Moniliophthora roreri]|uniref:Protein kinase domain-containing protein n=1 Tax=Moniliophthora roreri TaxID=221103 RepID=A0A0W0F122_MONRR|nr:calcium calmodulin dependent protein [Moniliophthora roreri]